MPGDRLLEVPIVLEVKGKSFRYVRTRAYDPTLVYRGRGTYLRIGPARLIDRELGLQKWLLDSGFPVAEVVDSGVLLGRGYFVEKSLGKATFTTAWGRDYRERGRVAARGFSRYMGLTRRFLLAQLSTAPGGHGNEFDAGVHIADTLEDLPGMKNKLLRALGQAKSRISVFPVVFCHGDFSPANFLDRGVVDFEWSFWGYAGYEAVTSLYWTYFFPSPQWKITGGYTSRRPRSQAPTLGWSTNSTEAAGSQSLPSSWTTSCSPRPSGRPRKWANYPSSRSGASDSWKV